MSLSFYSFFLFLAGLAAYVHNSSREVFWAGDSIFLSMNSRLRYHKHQFTRESSLVFEESVPIGISVSCHVLKQVPYCAFSNKLYLMTNTNDSFYGTPIRQFEQEVRFVEGTDYLLQFCNSTISQWKLNGNSTVEHVADFTDKSVKQYYIYSHSDNEIILYNTRNNETYQVEGITNPGCFVKSDRLVYFDAQHIQVYLVPVNSQQGQRSSLGITENIRGCYFNQDENRLYTLTIDGIFIHKVHGLQTRLQESFKFDSSKVFGLKHAFIDSDYLYLFQSSKLQVYRKNAEMKYGMAIAGAILGALVMAVLLGCLLYKKCRARKSGLQNVLVESEHVEEGRFQWENNQGL